MSDRKLVAVDSVPHDRAVRGYYVERRPTRFRAVQWTGENLDEVRALDPWGIQWDEHARMLYVSTLPVEVGDWLVVGPGGVSVLSPGLFAMEFQPATEAA
jgi:hypothetical protein